MVARGGQVSYIHQDNKCITLGLAALTPGAHLRALLCTCPGTGLQAESVLARLTTTQRRLWAVTWTRTHPPHVTSGGSKGKLPVDSGDLSRTQC